MFTAALMAMTQIKAEAISIIFEARPRPDLVALLFDIVQERKQQTA
jgi:hypothetical protein